jgi:4-amino-4-deoxy-L-arabinose transferase-like glycosyltransferase
MKVRFFLVLILVLAFFSRFYRFDLSPPSLYWDEVAIGYNAWSILTTGADEYGHRLPLSFKSFQDYKLPGFIYSIIPFIKLWGLAERSVRLPSIILGTLSVLFLFLLISQIANKKVALLSALFLAISPWAIQFSRAGFEVNAGVTITLGGIYFLLKGKFSNKWLFVGIILSVLSMYFYYTNRIFIPLFMLCYIPLFWQKWKRIKKELTLLLFLGILLSLPLFIFSSSYSRFSQVSLFSDPQIYSFSAEERVFDQNSLLARVLHNKYLVFGKELLNNYLSYYSPDFLFLRADGNPRHGVPGVGLLYFWQLPFLIYGIYKLIQIRNSSLKILLPWVLFAPIAASLAQPSPHALRGLLLMPVLSVFTAYGLYYFYKNINSVLKILTNTVLVGIVFYSMINYYHQLFIHYPIYSSRDWAYGYKQVFSFLKGRLTDYQNIYITGKYWRPYIFALFYLQYPADKYQQKPSHNKIENIYFGYADYDTSDPYYDYGSMEFIRDKIRYTPGSLLILSPSEKGAGDYVIKTIPDLKGEPLFLIVATKS